MVAPIATTNAVVTRNKALKETLYSDAIRQHFQKLQGRNADIFIANILNAAVSNPDLNQCEPMSIVAAATTCATLHLSLSPALGQAAIVAYRSRGGYKAQLQIMRKGLVQLALGTNKYRYLHVAKIYEGEVWKEDRLTGKMELMGAAKSRTVVGYVAYFQLLNGFEKYLAMSVDEILDHAHKYSKSWDKANKCFYKGSAWDTAFEKMCEKTPLRLLLMNYGYLSDDMQAAFEHENETGEPTLDLDFTEVEAEQPEPRHVTEAEGGPFPIADEPEQPDSPEQIISQLY